MKAIMMSLYNILSILVSSSLSFVSIDAFIIHHPTNHQHQRRRPAVADRIHNRIILKQQQYKEEESTATPPPRVNNHNEVFEEDNNSEIISFLVEESLQQQQEELIQKEIEESNNNNRIIEKCQGNNISENDENSDNKVRSVVILGGVHGNEYTGVWCIRAIEEEEMNNHNNTTKFHDSYPSLDIRTILANPEAFEQNRRFIDTDLNREFTTSKLYNTNNDSSKEARRAKELNELLGPKPIIGEDEEESFTNKKKCKTDVIIDLHSSTSNMGTTLIVPEGDELMTMAAAYTAYSLRNEKKKERRRRSKQGGGEETAFNDNRYNDDGDDDDDVHILVHPLPDRNVRPNVASLARMGGITIEVGPVPQGILRYDAIEKTQKALQYVLEFLELYNNSGKNNKMEVKQLIQEWYYNNDNEEEATTSETIDDDNNNKVDTSIISEITATIPCWRSAKAIENKGSNNEYGSTTTTTTTTTMSGKIPWPTMMGNFPLVVVHPSIQDMDFKKPIRHGDPLFITPGKEGTTTINYDGTTFGDEVYLMFINEGGYYYANSGAGISVIQPTKYHLSNGTFVGG